MINHIENISLNQMEQNKKITHSENQQTNFLNCINDIENKCSTINDKNPKNIKNDDSKDDENMDSESSNIFIKIFHQIQDKISEAYHDILNIRI
ncbi:hypothetical protein [Buchnera aphidicola]|uniref:hypothetical protein n=1 Tax=Buchnera aphidicola TaxID=9 RepID=UPI003464CB74